MTLHNELTQRLQTKPILLMTHLVLGYPSLAVNKEVISRMAASGVDCIELQIPFSEPIADGPVICRANQEALSQGITVAACFEFAREMAAAHPQVIFLFMTYYNIVFRMGETLFLERTAAAGLRGTIIPDLPAEEGEQYRATSRDLGLASIGFFTPTSDDDRMAEVGAMSDGFIYCVARRGVTGSRTRMDGTILEYLRRCRSATQLPLAVGFGIGTHEDVAILQGQADMAVVGTATIRLVDRDGPEAVGPFIESLLGAR